MDVTVVSIEAPEFGPDATVRAAVRIVEGAIEIEYLDVEDFDESLQADDYNVYAQAEAFTNHDMEEGRVIEALNRAEGDE